MMIPLGSPSYCWVNKMVLCLADDVSSFNRSVFWGLLFVPYGWKLSILMHTLVITVRLGSQSCGPYLKSWFGNAVQILSCDIMLQAFNFKPFGKLQCTWPAHTYLSSTVFGAGFPWLFVAGNFFCFLSWHMQPWQHKPNLVVQNILHRSLKLLLFFLECQCRFALEFCRTQCADRNSVLPYTLIWFGVWVEQAMGRGLAAPSNQVVHTHFAISENVGDVLAKEEVWTVAAELCGLALGVCILVKSVLQLFSSSPAYIGWTQIILKNSQYLWR